MDAVAVFRCVLHVFIILFYKGRVCVCSFFMYDIFLPLESAFIIEQMGSWCLLLGQTFVTRGLTLIESKGNVLEGAVSRPPPLP